MYGLGTRSYNRSTERRENKRLQAEATAKYLRGEMQVGSCETPLMCGCRSFNLPHPPARHSELLSDYDWRTEAERRGMKIFREVVK